ncbi:uncharacterized protein EMH_0040180 [Eimeria mitis]|uniref:EF-hand domain-containing protein n=1 Tax=Eimeria mitis TaxID=44415 RepID=U6JWF1_9EIME|nr:uncharacterized protein EMH_0040180 [Eimeria mitis]CDJ28352.1 hypothetical protein, conserved [Eimeria mitis]
MEVAKGPLGVVGFGHFSRAAEAQIVVGGDPDAPRGSRGPKQKYQTLSEMLQGENCLSGLFESYNNHERPLGSLMTLQQLQRGCSASRRQHEVLSWGLSPQVSRQVSIHRMKPSLGNCIPFKEFLSTLTAADIFNNMQATEYPVEFHVMNSIALSSAIETLVNTASSFYFTITDFCQALEPLLLQQASPLEAHTGAPKVAPDLNPKPSGGPEGHLGAPSAPAVAGEWEDQQEVRRALEDAFEEIQGGRCGAVNVLEVLLGLSRYCSVNRGDRIKASFALFDRERRGSLNFLVVAAVFHHLHRMLLTPSVVDKLRRADLPFQNVRAAEAEVLQGEAAAARAEAAASQPAGAAETAAAAAAAAAAEYVSKELFVDITEEPWKTAAHYADLNLTFDEFAKEYAGRV